MVESVSDKEMELRLQISRYLRTTVGKRKESAEETGRLKELVSTRAIEGRSVGERNDGGRHTRRWL